MYSMEYYLAGKKTKKLLNFFYFTNVLFTASFLFVFLCYVYLVLEF